MPKRRKKSLTFRQELAEATNFCGPGASLSIKDTKKTKKSKLVGNWGSNTPLGRRIYYGEICGGASKQTKDGSPEPNRRRKQWIGGVGLKKVFRGGVRGVRAGVRGGMRECSAPIEIRRNRKESQKSLFFEVTLKRYPRRCPRQFLSNELLCLKIVLVC